MGFRGTKKQLDAAKAVAVGLAGEQLKKAIVANVSIPPIGGSAATHAAALRQLGSPYSKRYGSIQIRPSGGYPGFGKRELLVHSVSGRLRRSITGVFKPGGSPSYQIRADRRTAPHAGFVTQGTRVMHARDILQETSVDPAVRLQLQRTVVKVFGQLFRSKAGLRFG